MSCNNIDNLITRGNDFYLAVTLKSREMVDGQVVVTAFDFDDCDNYDARIYGILRGNTLGTLVGLKDGTTDTVIIDAKDIPLNVAIAVEVTGKKDGRAFRAAEKGFIGIVEYNGQAHVIFTPVTGGQEANLVMTLQFLPSAAVVGKNAYEIWKEQPGNEGKTLDDFIDYIGHGESAYEIAVRYGYTGTEAEYNMLYFDAVDVANTAGQNAQQAADTANEMAAQAQDAAELADAATTNANNAATAAAAAVDAAIENMEDTLNAAIADQDAEIASKEAEIDAEFATQTALINQKQMEIGAVPSDLVPTAGSTHWVTSGGVYDAMSAVNAVLNDAMSFSEWVVGSLNSSHTYLDMTGRIEACAVIDGRELNYTVASGYAMSIHEYSGEFYTIPTIIGNTWIKQTSSWIEGSGTFIPDSQTKTIVVILSKTPTGSQLNIQPSDAVNLTIGYASAFTLDEMREMLAAHDVDIEAMQSELYSEIANAPVWYQGTLNDNHSYISSGGNTPQRIICTVAAPSVMDVTVAPGYYCSIHEYSAFFQNPTQIISAASWLGNTHSWFDGTLKVTPLAATKTMVLIMSKGSNKDQNVTPTDGSNISVESLVSIKRQTDINTESIERINDTLDGINTGGGVYIPSWYQGTLNNNYVYVSSGGNTPQRIICTVPVTDMLNVTVASGYLASVHEYSEVYANVTEITNGNAWLGNTHSWFDGSMDITPLAATKTFVIVMSKGNKNVNISPSEGSNTTITTGGIHVEGLVEKVGKLAYDDSDSYYWGADMIKRKCRTTYLGMLTYLQAFCKYDGKYYSTNGSSIAEQDENFNVLRNVTCSVGHGNSLQLVSNGKAWASGWDDQKMYRVDLATLTVDKTITLPTTGYTTCAVDEDNGWMYIFQRQTNPSTEAQYNFIKYDYVNEQIISTRKIETFAAMQSVDYWQGKILMLNGFGTQAAPSGMRIYNTNGDVLVTYDLQVLRAKEPEGIIFTRDTGELLVSDVDKKLYIIS